ncbi:MAG: hypothetical protein ACOVMP_11460 [Chthoniobacterales bacterium]
MPDRQLNIRKRGDDRSFRRKEVAEKKDTFASAIGWTIFMLLLVALVALCWLGTYYVFGHPEEPTSYALLKKLNKIEQPRRFVDTAAPRGEFLTGNQLFERYDAMRDPELRRESSALLRDFLWNYKNTSKPTPYIIGRFNILDSYELTPSDFFTSGVVALAQDTDNPKVLLEHIFTAEERMVPMLHRSLLTGLDIPIKRTYDLSAVINIRRLEDGRLVFTAIPLHYPSYTAASGPGGFALEPPSRLNVEASLPIIQGERIKDADARYAMYRRKAGLIDDPTAAVAMPGQPNVAAAPPADALIRVQPAVPVNAPTANAQPTPTPMMAPVPLEPEPRVEAAIPVAMNTLPPAPAEVTPPEPTPTPAPSPEATPTPTPTPEVELKPFQSPSPSPTPKPAATPAQAVASTAGGRWQTYKPGQMPRGRLMNVKETQQIADQGTPSERVYLQGNFVVTASGQNRAVLRSQGGGPLGIGGAANTRIIVEFPSGAKAPGEGASVSRGSDRPFLITDVKKTADGQINVFVREVTSD